MRPSRRQFLRQTSTGAAMLSMGAFPNLAMTRPQMQKLTILHTNDVHSRIDPFPMDGSRNAGLGGASKRMRIIEEIREQEEHVLLLDSGDIFQGTPYFNFFGGELEFKLMSLMQYDAGTIGNHDFDAGIDGLARQVPNASFPLINCNYDFRDTIMEGKSVPYQVFEKDRLRVGVLGVGIELNSLVPEKLYGATRYLDPVTEANVMAEFLRSDEKCDYIICLSHLGYRYRDSKIDDVKLAANSRHIDLILGGHTHTFMKAPEIVANKDNNPVTINQVGWAGILLGRLDIHFEYNRKNRCLTCQNRLVE
ncbi:MAG: metallophosphatase [Saprospiraceae bacterium]|nr:metallophosphatase [Saprospiraceae bacterium]